LILESLWARTKDVSAHLSWVQVVVDQSFDDSGKLARHQQVAGCLESTDDLAEGMANLLHKVNDLLLCGVAGDEVVQVSDDVHADVAGELVASLGNCRSCKDKAGEQEQDLHDGAG